MNRGVNVIVFNDDETEVLLQKRRDFRIWALPGGHIESGEPWEKAGIRETFEETGYRIEVYRYVGEYSQPQMPRGGVVASVCLGRVIGGEPIGEGPETVGVRWFPVDELPGSLPAYHCEFIHDAKTGSPVPFQKVQRVSIIQGFVIRLLFRLRDTCNQVLRSH